MTRIALGVAYNGASYHGWQFQQQGIATVQQSLQLALGKIADQPVQVICAGRTDTGVHASNQVVHFDCDAQRDAKAWVAGTNAHLPDDISVTWMRRVEDGFDARRSATSRRYIYVIYNSKIRSALMPDLMTRHIRLLDAPAMHESAQALLGENDFSSFRAAGCQSNSPMRNIQRIKVSRFGDLVVMDIAANAFLHHMVRNIAGVMMEVGGGLKPTDWTKTLLALKDRTAAGVTAPANGLFLVQVDYPEYSVIPEGPALPHFLANLPIG